MKDEDFYKMISGMMEAREKERMLGIRVLIIAHNAYKFQGCAQITAITCHSTSQSMFGSSTLLN